MDTVLDDQINEAHLDVESATKTGREVIAKFRRDGISVAEWARKNNFYPDLVYVVLAGRRKCMRGQSHRIAVALGLKKK